MKTSSNLICQVRLAISELLVIKVFDAIETVGQQEETSLLRLVVGYDDTSGTQWNAFTGPLLTFCQSRRVFRPIQPTVQQIVGALNVMRQVKHHAQ